VLEAAIARLEVASGLSPMALAWCALVLAVAGFARGYSGFGFSAIVVAGFGFVAGPVVAAPLAILLEVMASLFQARSVWRQIAWRDALAMLAGSLAGNPLGVVVLEHAPETPLKAAIYLYVLAVCAILLAARASPRLLGNLAWFAVGLIAGVINGATALSGLFIVSVMTLTATPPSRMRATLIAYFFFSDFYAAALLAMRGLIGAQMLVLAAIAFPIVAAGIMLGSRRFLSASDAEFRKATLLLLVALATLGLAKIALAV
jgi:uncharacterized membrane protein YfcA